jgi:glycerol uptake facilitator-like aquaporin
VAGAAAGAGLIRLAVPEEYWRSVKLGTPLLNSDFTVGQGLIIEGVLTFFLVWVVFATSVDRDGAYGKIAGLAVGFAVIMGVMVAGPFTGAAMNPARSFGPALVGGYWSQELMYWVGPLAGGAIAGLLYELVVLRPGRAA